MAEPVKKPTPEEVFVAKKQGKGDIVGLMSTGNLVTLCEQRKFDAANNAKLDPTKVCLAAFEQAVSNERNPNITPADKLVSGIAAPIHTIGIEAGLYKATTPIDTIIKRRDMILDALLDNTRNSVVGESSEGGLQFMDPKTKQPGYTFKTTCTTAMVASLADAVLNDTAPPTPTLTREQIEQKARACFDDKNTSINVGTVVGQQLGAHLSPSLPNRLSAERSDQPVAAMTPQVLR